MKAIKISDNVYWVGAIDWDVRNFHGYRTQRGTTYNAYLIIDKKITLIDTVKPAFTDQLIERISSVINPEKIDYIVSNHVEMDHSGALPAIIKYTPDAEIITCPNGEKGLKAHYKNDWKFNVVNTGDLITIGDRSLQFVLTPMVHWPDNMVTYMPEQKILFSNDAFGQHYASTNRFDDECPVDVVMEEAKKYYANIVLPYSKQVQKALSVASKLDIEIIATSHGVGWKKNIDKILNKYEEWSSNKTIKKVVIIYDTMWKSTEKIAYAIHDAFESQDYQIVMCNLQHIHISDIMTELIDAEYICVGSPTLNKNIMPSVAGFLTYLNGLASGSKKAISFGSYGWGEQIKKIDEYFKNTGFEIIESVKHKYIPDSEDLLRIKNNIIEKSKL